MLRRVGAKQAWRENARERSGFWQRPTVVPAGSALAAGELCENRGVRHGTGMRKMKMKDASVIAGWEEHRCTTRSMRGSAQSPAPRSRSLALPSQISLPTGAVARLPREEAIARRGDDGSG